MTILYNKPLVAFLIDQDQAIEIKPLLGARRVCDTGAKQSCHITP